MDYSEGKNMRMWKKNYLSICLLSVTVFFFAGCGCIGLNLPGGTVTDVNISPVIVTDSHEETIQIEDIDWNVNEGIIDGVRFVLLDYINNSDFTITRFELTFKEKPNIPEENKMNYYAEIQNFFNLSEEDFNQLKNKDIEMYAETDRIADPGESVNDVYFYYYRGNYYVKEINHYDFVEPDIATIMYIIDDKIVTVYYDFASKKYSIDNETEIAYYWSQSNLGTMIPKPDSMVVKKGGRDDEQAFMFEAYDYPLEKFNTYVDECKALGFTVEPGSYDGFYSAYNVEGYKVYLYLEEDNNHLNGIFSAPEN